MYTVEVESQTPMAKRFVTYQTTPLLRLLLQLIVTTPVWLEIVVLSKMPVLALRFTVMLVSFVNNVLSLVAGIWAVSQLPATLKVPLLTIQVSVVCACTLVLPKAKPSAKARAAPRKFLVSFRKVCPTVGN